jgi:hypothetical protein
MSPPVRVFILLLIAVLLIQLEREILPPAP